MNSLQLLLTCIQGAEFAANVRVLYREVNRHSPDTAKKVCVWIYIYASIYSRPLILCAST